MNMDATAILLAEGADRRTSSISPTRPSSSAACGHYSRANVADAVEKIRTTLVLYIGETIIDEYQYCESLGKSGKEPVLAVRYVSDEKFAGGVLATATSRPPSAKTLACSPCWARNIRTRNSSVRSSTPISTPRFFPCRRRARSSNGGWLRPIRSRNCSRSTSWTWRCRKQPAAPYDRLQAVLPGYDAVVVTDYGHGMLTPEIIELLCASDCFLAVDAQTNAANQGFDGQSKYRRADFVCLSEKEQCAWKSAIAQRTCN